MVSVTVRKRDGAICDVTVSGHSGFAKKGKDIVCSAASMLVINAFNSIENFTDDDIVVDSGAKGGYARLRFTDAPSHDASLLMESMIFGLGQIIAEYGDKYINLVIEEE